MQVASYRLGAGDLSQLLASFDQTAIMFLESAANAVIIPWDENLQLDDWERGNCFDEKHQVEWERGDGAYRVQVFSEQDLISGPVETVNLDQDYLRQSRSYLLWGQRLQDDDHWWEYRIPRLLDYPVENSHRVKIEVEEYRNAATAMLEFYRYKALRGVS